MKDIQDGIKVSIQDGVEEDPEKEEALDIGAKTTLSIRFIVKEITCPKPITTVNFSTDVTAKTATVTTVLGTGVA